jgi:hypothetical protein
MVTLKAKSVTLDEVQRLLGFKLVRHGKFEDFLTLLPLSPVEQNNLEVISSELFDYIENGKISEGQAQLIAIAPLLRLAGYNRPPIEYRVEENIATIYIEDEETHIRGRFDIVAVNRNIQTSSTSLLWILVIESKSIGASEYVGIAQMLTYAYSSLANQNRVWGLVTNGANYQFFYIQKGEKLIYQRMPNLNLLDPDPATQLIQVLKAIREWDDDRNDDRNDDHNDSSNRSINRST